MYTRAFFVIAMLTAIYAMDTPIASVGGEDCPVTSPNGIAPRGELAGPNWYYQNGIYIGMDGDGFIHAKTEDGGKTGWIKAIVYHDVGSDTFEVGSKYPGSESGDMEVVADIKPAFGRQTPIHVGGVTFPADGCWELTYSTGTASMTFVVDVRFVDSWSATPTN